MFVSLSRTIKKASALNLFRNLPRRLGRLLFSSTSNTLSLWDSLFTLLIHLLSCKLPFSLCLGLIPSLLHSVTINEKSLVPAWLNSKPRWSSCPSPVGFIASLLDYYITSVPNLIELIFLLSLSVSLAPFKKHCNLLSFTIILLLSLIELIFLLSLQ